MLSVAHVCVWTGETCACAAWCQPRLLVVAGFCGRRAHLRSVVRLCCLSWLLPPVVGPRCLPRASAVGDVRPLSFPGCCRLSWARVVWCELRLSVVNSCRILLEPVACGCWPGPCCRPASAAWIEPPCGLGPGGARCAYIYIYIYVCIYIYMYVCIAAGRHAPNHNERPGEAPPQSKLEHPGETKTKRKRSPSTHKVEPRKVRLIPQIAQWTILNFLRFQQFWHNPKIVKIVES